MGRSGKIQKSTGVSRSQAKPEALGYLIQVKNLEEDLKKDPDNEKLKKEIESTAGSEKYREILSDMSSQFEKRGSLSERQISFILKIKETARKKALEKARLPEPSPVPDPPGRMLLKGEVLSIKYKENHFGGGWKIVFVDQQGFRLYGSLPSLFIENGEPVISPGEVIVFEADVEKSSDDPNFGFFKRPKAV